MCRLLLSPLFIIIYFFISNEMITIFLVAIAISMSFFCIPFILDHLVWHLKGDSQDELDPLLMTSCSRIQATSRQNKAVGKKPRFREDAKSETARKMENARVKDQKLRSS